MCYPTSLRRRGSGPGLGTTHTPYLSVPPSSPDLTVIGLCKGDRESLVLFSSTSTWEDRELALPEFRCHTSVLKEKHVCLSPLPSPFTPYLTSPESICV